LLSHSEQNATTLSSESRLNLTLTLAKHAKVKGGEQKHFSISKSDGQGRNTNVKKVGVEEARARPPEMNKSKHARSMNYKKPLFIKSAPKSQ
jgi:hypothetical protein